MAQRQSERPCLEIKLRRGLLVCGSHDVEGGLLGRGGSRHEEGEEGGRVHEHHTSPKNAVPAGEAQFLTSAD